MRTKKIVAPSVVQAARSALVWTAKQAKVHRADERAYRDSMRRAKEQADLEELEMHQLEGFLRDAGLDETEIRQLKGDK